MAHRSHHYRKETTCPFHARHPLRPIHVRKKVISLLGSRFKLTVNRSYQGEWLTAPTMSPRRKQVLETAINMGYYDHPRQCKQQDIAMRLERKQGTIAEHLLLAEGNILKAWFEQSRISE